MKYAYAPERAFPVLLDHRDRKRFPNAPRFVPWSLLAPHAAQAMANHDQTLERLAQRGGLDPCEMWAVVHGRPLRDIRRLDVKDAIAWLMSAA